MQQGSEEERQYITWQAARFDENRHEVVRMAAAERRSTPAKKLKTFAKFKILAQCRKTELM